MILVLAANTAFNGFPVLGLDPGQGRLRRRGARLARRPAGLQQRHRVPGRDGDRPDRGLRRPDDPADPALHRGRLRVVQPQPARHDPALDPAACDREATRPSGGGCTARGSSTPSDSAFTAVVLVIVLITKFLAGAWITILAMLFFFMVMRGIQPTTTSVALELAADEEDKVMPTRVHAIVLVSKLHKPTLRALAFAKASRPNVLEGVYVGDGRPRRPTGCWRSGTSATSASRSRSCTRPTARWSGRSSTTPPRSGRPTRAAWSRSTSRSTSSVAGGSSCCTTRRRCGSRAGCCSRPGVMVISVPYQLRSSQIAREREERESQRVRPGDLRRGQVSPAAPPRRRRR